MRFLLLPVFLFSAILTAQGNLPRVGIIDFNAKSVSKTEASAITDLFRGEMIAGKNFNVLDRKNMDVILREQEFQQTGCTESSCAVRLGKMLNMEYMIYGNVVKLGTSYFIQIEMVKIETGQVRFTAKEKCTSFSDADVTTAKLVHALTRSVAESDARLASAMNRQWSTLRSLSFWSGLGSAAAGGGLLTGGMIVLGNAATYHSGTYSVTNGVTPEEVAVRYTTYSGLMDAGNIMNVTAYSLIGTGVILFALSFFLPDEIALAPKIGISPSRDGFAFDTVSFSLSYRF